MTMTNRESVPVVVAVALAPLGLVALANYPVLTLCMAWMVGAAYCLHRWTGPRPGPHAMVPHAEMSRRTEDVIPAEIPRAKRNWFVERWLWLWHHPNHAGVMLGCVAVILFPVDDLVGIWFDDLGAMILFVKHARDIFRQKWGKAPEVMVASQAQEFIARARDTVESPSALSPRRFPAKSAR